MTNLTDAQQSFAPCGAKWPILNCFTASTHQIALHSRSVKQKNEENVDSLKLGLAGLPDAEINLISTLFRLHRVEPSFIWRLQSEPPFDALLVDASLSEDLYGHLCGLRTNVMRLSCPASKVEGEMPRPIRSDRLVAWLNSIEVGLLHGGHDGFASTASLSRSSELPSIVEQRRVKPLQPAQASEEASINTSDATLLYKLKRWPPTNELGKDIGRIRVATMLSRKPISLEELISLSRVSKHDCESFLRRLSQLQLLSIERRSAASLDFDLLAEFTIKEEAPKTALKGGLGLIRSIRRRFGLI